MNRALVSDADIPGGGVEKPQGAEVVLPRSYEIHSLRPEFKSEDHALYVGYIRTELNRPSRAGKGTSTSPLSDEVLRPRNIALTGGYGAGKSSVLSKIVSEFGDRVVSVSLSTLGKEEVKTEPDSDEVGPLEVSPVTNAIQKEIVKQLLYREKPSKVPGSRYRRIERFRHRRALLLAVLLASALTAIAFLTESLARVEALFEDNGWLELASYGGLFVLIMGVAYGLQWIFHNRIRISQVSSGQATVSLSDKSESFFDKYLDEIVYFFETNKYDVVIFEDLDRFNDPYIFETLRELNTLLNNSKQIDPKTITFIYAIKDSIFEQLGQISINGVRLNDDEIRQLAVTNRTKFFDVVIPVVPFISHRNSRDLIGKEMKGSGFIVDKVLADLISKHLVDMRLIKNIHNEFAIFQQKIMAPQGIKELNAQSLFAMVVYKNLHMTEFERIKEGTGALDRVFADYRLLVNQQIASKDRAIRATELMIRRSNSIGARSRQLGDRLEAHIRQVLGYVGSELSRATMVLAETVTAANLRTADFWREWLADEDLTLTITYSTVVSTNYYGSQTVTLPIKLTLTDLRASFNDTLDLSDWESSDLQAQRDQIQELTIDRDFLKHASMKAVAARPEFKLELGGDQKAFVVRAADHLGEGLALGLVKAGYIDRNFSLYVSLYYDETVTVQARNYLLHSVETNIMDANAQIGTGPEIDAMLFEAGDGIFTELSIFNVQIFDHLLANGEAKLDKSIAMLAKNVGGSHGFLSTYIAAGAHASRLVAALTPHWVDILGFLRTDLSVAEEQRRDLLDEALSALSEDIDYNVDASLGEFIQPEWRAYTSLVEARKLSSATKVINVLREAEVEFDALDEVSFELQPGVVAHSLYALTVDNLMSALDGQENLSLNTIRASNADVFKYVANNLATYLEIQASSPTTSFTVDDHAAFISTMNELPSSSSENLWAVVDRAKGLTITKLTPLKEHLWPLVARARKLTANISNVTNYVEKMGSIDDDLAVTLNSASVITDLDEAEDAEQRALALLLVNAQAVLPDQRIKLTKSLTYTTPLLVSEISLDPTETAFPANLLADGLIQDVADSFNELGDLPWVTKSAFIQASTSFRDYILDISISASELEKLVKDPQVDNRVKVAVLTNLDSFAGKLTAPVMTALAQFSLSSGTSIGGARILAMASAGVASRLIVELAASESTALSLDELVAVLHVMPQPYRKLTTTNGSTKLPNSLADIWLVDRLIALEQISSRDSAPSGADFRVNLRRSVERQGAY